jgi:hypothetical protein
VLFDSWTGSGKILNLSWLFRSLKFFVGKFWISQDILKNDLIQNFLIKINAVWLILRKIKSFWVNLSLNLKWKINDFWNFCEMKMFKIIFPIIFIFAYSQTQKMILFVSHKYFIKNQKISNLSIARKAATCWTRYTLSIAVTPIKLHR